MSGRLITILFTILMGTAAQSNMTAVDASERYVSGLLDLLDTTKSTNVEIEVLKIDVSKAESHLKLKSNEVVETEGSITTKESRLQSIPNLISQNDRSIIRKEQEQKNILDVNFPDASNVDDAISKTRFQKQNLVSEKQRLESSLRSIEREYNQSIESLRSLINNKNSSIKSHQKELVSNREKRSALRIEIESLRKEIRDLRAIKDAPGFEQRLRQARAAYRQAENLRASESRNCDRRNFLGRYRDRSKTCKDFRAARSLRNRLNAINSGESIRLKRDQLQSKTREIDTLKSRSERLQASIRRLEDEVSIDQRRLQSIEEDKRSATNPTRQALFQIEFDLERIERKLSLTRRLETLQTEVTSHRSNISRYERQRETFPDQIIRLRQKLTSLYEQKENATRLLFELKTQQDELLSSMSLKSEAVEQSRLNLLGTLKSTKPSLLPVDSENPNSEMKTLLYDSKDWGVWAVENDSEWSRMTCKVETSLEVFLGELEVFSSLSVLNIKNAQGEYNEPLVQLTVESNTGLDLNAFKNANLRPSSTSKYFDMDLIYSKSDETKLVFLSKLSDREELIRLIAAKNTMFVNLVTENPEVSENISFSLRGSSNSLKSSRNQSLKTACGGIEVTAFN